MGSIYKITNQLNGKSYIGKTTWPVQTRWNAHINVAIGNNNTHSDIIHLALAKYGIDNFSFEVLETISNDKLNEREQYWIEHFNTYIHAPNSQGYNMTRGGEGTLHVDVKEILRLWNEGYSEGEIVLLVHCTDMTCSHHLKENGITPEEIQERGRERAVAKQKKTLYQYNLKGDLIKIWPSLASVNAEGFSETAICNYMRDPNRRSSYNSFWTYDPDELPNLLSRLKKKKITLNQKVGQYDLQGNLIKIWDSAAEADKNNIAHASAIRKCCKNEPKYKTASGFIWKYIENN